MRAVCISCWNSCRQRALLSIEEDLCGKSISFGYINSRSKLLFEGDDRLLLSRHRRIGLWI
uniref:Uncharacterized protein n=1 Tax=Rhizophora mucronata TaxID=61149 RepID=A0A2P2PVM6_RHIMU